MSWRLASVAIGWLATALTLSAAITNDDAASEIEGREVVRQLLATQPAENLAHSAVLKIRDGKGRKREIPVRSHIIATETNWLTVYETLATTNVPESETLTVTHTCGQPNRYALSYQQPSGRVDVTFGPEGFHLSRQGNPEVDAAFLPFKEKDSATGALTMRPFAGSDFWFVDLGLEFLHWPGQKVLKKELKRGQSCYVLESRNPEPAAGRYARVLSWLDIDSVRDSGQAAIVQAEAYDARNKLLKEFDLKEVGKINGQWQVKEIEIRNVQTGSRTLLKFNFDKQ